VRFVPLQIINPLEKFIFKIVLLFPRRRNELEAIPQSSLSVNMVWFFLFSFFVSYFKVLPLNPDNNQIMSPDLA
jgi:K+-transporting ATPase ATPase A chain